MSLRFCTFIRPWVNTYFITQCRNQMNEPVKIYGQVPYFVAGSLKPGKPEKATKKPKIEVKRISLDDMIRNKQLKEPDDKLSFEVAN